MNYELFRLEESLQVAIRNVLGNFDLKVTGKGMDGLYVKLYMLLGIVPLDGCFDQRYVAEVVDELQELVDRMTYVLLQWFVQNFDMAWLSWLDGVARVWIQRLVEVQRVLLRRLLEHSQLLFVSIKMD